MTIVSIMFVGFILSLFGADDMFTNALSSLFNRTISKSVYWFVFFIIGLVFWILRLR